MVSDNQVEPARGVERIKKYDCVTGLFTLILARITLAVITKQIIKLSRHTNKKGRHNADPFRYSLLGKTTQ